jgi:hypothetical protein
MGRYNNETNGKQVAVGCFMFVLIAIVVVLVGEASGIKAFLGVIAIILIFLLGAFLTEAFKE